MSIPLSLVHLIYTAGDKCMRQNACFYCVNTSYPMDNCFSTDRSRQTSEKDVLYILPAGPVTECAFARWRMVLHFLFTPLDVIASFSFGAKECAEEFLQRYVFTPQPLRAVGVLFSPMVSGWAGRREIVCPGCISETVRCRKLILGRDIG